MLKVGVIGQKGGSGKSTLCWVLANAVIARGKKVLLVDTDPQASTSAFVTKAYQRHPKVRDVLSGHHVNDPNELEDVIDEAERQGFDVVIVDTQGAHSEVARDLILLVDCVVVPTTPGIHAFESQLVTIDFYERILAEIGAERAATLGLVATNIKPKVKLNAEQSEAMREFFSHPRSLDWPVPARNGFETLGFGRIIAAEIQAMDSDANKFKRDALILDLAEAEMVLTSVEGLAKKSRDNIQTNEEQAHGE